MAADLDYAEADAWAVRELGHPRGYDAALCAECTGSLGIIDVIMLERATCGCRKPVPPGQMSCSTRAVRSAAWCRPGRSAVG